MNQNKNPSVSIVIPCRNEKQHIAPCLDSVLAFDYSTEDLEIIVVDGMSTDDTRTIVRPYVEKNSTSKLLDNPKKTVSPAINIGVINARGEIIIRLDAHSTYPPEYARLCVELLKKTKAGNAGGRFINITNGNGPWAEPIKFVTGHIFGVGSGIFRVGTKAEFVDTVPFGTFRRDLFISMGMFDERLTRNEDNEFNDRLRRAGYKIAFDPDIKIYYKNQATLSGLLKQAYFTAMWNIYTLKLYPYTFKWRRFVPAAFVAYLLLAPVAVMLGITTLYSLPAMLYTAIAVCIAATAPYGLEEKLRILVTFILYHLAFWKNDY